MDIFSSIFLALIVYLLGIASPGPSNLAIAHTSIYSGRKAGVFLALGITTGSFFWGFLATSGLQPILNEYANFLYILKILGGVYFLYLAYKSFKFSFDVNSKKTDFTLKAGSNISYFLSGLLMHLLNPKAIAVWIAIIAIALPNNAQNTSIFLPVIVCLPFGILVFVGYAFIFSSKSVVHKYFDFKKYIDRIVGTIFAAVGLKLIFGSEK